MSSSAQDRFTSPGHRAARFLLVAFAGLVAALPAALGQEGAPPGPVSTGAGETAGERPAPPVLPGDAAAEVTELEAKIADLEKRGLK